MLHLIGQEPEELSLEILSWRNVKKKKPEVKTKDKLRWVTEETLKIVSGK